MSMTPETIQRFNAVLLSCLEGHSGKWDCSTSEGKEGFLAMAEDMRLIAEDLDIPIEDWVVAEVDGGSYSNHFDDDGQ